MQFLIKTLNFFIRYIKLNFKEGSFYDKNIRLGSASPFLYLSLWAFFISQMNSFDMIEMRAFYDHLVDPGCDLPISTHAIIMQSVVCRDSIWLLCSGAAAEILGILS